MICYLINCLSTVCVLVRAPPLGGCPIVITLSVCLSACLSANFNIVFNFFNIRDRVFIFCMSVSDGNVNDLTVTFDLLMKNFNIAHNFLTVSDRTSMFRMCS